MVTPLKDMRPKHLLCRITSVRRTRNDSPDPQEPTPQTWEVRAVTDLGIGDGPTSLFYTESNPRNLPPLESLIHVTIDPQLTTTDAVPETTDTDEVTGDSGVEVEEVVFSPLAVPKTKIHSRCHLCHGENERHRFPCN